MCKTCPSNHKYLLKFVEVVVVYFLFLSVCIRLSVCTSQVLLLSGEGLPLQGLRISISLKVFFVTGLDLTYDDLTNVLTVDCRSIGLPC